MNQREIAVLRAINESALGLHWHALTSRVEPYHPIWRVPVIGYFYSLYHGLLTGAAIRNLHRRGFIYLYSENNTIADFYRLTRQGQNVLELAS